MGDDMVVIEETGFIKRKLCELEEDTLKDVLNRKELLKIDEKYYRVIDSLVGFDKDGITGYIIGYQVESAKAGK